MLRGAEPVDAARLRASRGAGEAAGLEGRPRLEPTTQPASNRSSAPKVPAKTTAACWMLGRPAGTTPPTRPSPISPIAVLTSAPPTGYTAIQVPASRHPERHRDLSKLHVMTPSRSMSKTRREGNLYQVASTVRGACAAVADDSSR
jgi:hypothetical protein